MLETPKTNQEPLWLVIIRLLRWNKPEGRLILMIPALWAVFLAAGGKPPIPLVGVIICGSMATSAAGCVVNDLWDRDIDPQVERTRDRPLASRALSVKIGIVVGIVSLACAAVIAFYLNPLSFWLSVAAVPVIVLYPGAKRVFPVPQLVLSIAWGFAVLISWSAVTANITAPTWLLWGATVLWTLGFDTIYAMSDRIDDKRIGINSSAIFFGKYAPTAIAIFLMGTVILLAGVGVLVHLKTAFWISLIFATIGWIWQITRLQQPKIPHSAYGEMFRQNVWIGFLILAGMIIGSF
ncbi:MULTISPECIES: 4-hydroxybenzoate solanesyltransferase [Nostocales]|jgi:4-hydroxybenzoate polyprenyltransferase|uniref:4-hydroxybenzoate octaprenyltransferase n=2 Tax=Aphanizomenonaceae TaxID=1892259 RepID=A0ACC7S3E4_DOLFA|nr:MULTISPECIES: 4-hydroxybenzoate solanesyltransferase [Nostocales]MBO1069913.1 4-hydroxybenzoate solanesyltransferase [Dolichospermum sp. DEX189]ALB39396.1 4-hydroxybenzoate polyprenyltransferase [Anabaena sp. WA102]MBD2277639.1 4-hydroxybenzoate solanesyltransferase [Aphanizomenon flos-aquae FACHB-1040]MBO1066645.1 4-hydroxybenzoate solanesyltransferase [Anabaena sp. 54]MTJ43018.1 4-hydroxybenzoate octaprenyltransferase [Dolichospermum flos-aquae UHCC 0037]